MLAHERNRHQGKAPADDAVHVSDFGSVTDALGLHGRLRKGRRFQPKRFLSLSLRVLGLLCVCCVFMVLYSRYATNAIDATPRDKSPALPNGSVTGTKANRNSSNTVPRTLVPSPRPGNGESPPLTTADPAAADDNTSLAPMMSETPLDPRTKRPNTFNSNLQNQREEGEYAPEEPDLLPGLFINRYTFTPAELLERFQNTTFIYSFVNGSELNHEYRKEVRGGCLPAILKAEADSYDRAYPTFLIPTTKAPAETTPTPGAETSLEPTETAAMPPTTPFAVLRCWPSRLGTTIRHMNTVGELLAAVASAVHLGVDNRDRETDELRHSIRSVEQHVGWHRGRVVIVSPGHHPTWVDGAKNFLAGVCGDATVQALRSRGTHLRLTTVHQDAIMPYGMRFTANSHVIEQHIWRVRNTTAVHVYMNDDYFVNRDVAITDLFNEYGGTIVRTEAGMLKFGSVADGSPSWQQGVLHGQQFNIQELDVHHEDYIPEDLITMWGNFNRLGFDTAPSGSLPVVRASNADDAVHIGRNFPAGPMNKTPLRPRRHRRYATHAPFVYCTNMFRFLGTRYEREFALTSLYHRERMARDLFIPFLYNAFIMARPWQASPQFLPYLLQLHRSRQMQLMAMTPVLNISLDNFDGCAPASLRGGADASECTYAKFMNNLTLNEGVMANIARTNPLYFNINAGFTSSEAADQLRQFLHEKFPTPVYLEAPAAAAVAEEMQAGGEDAGEDVTTTTTGVPAAADVALQSVFAQLMALPVVGLVSYAEGVCPLVRSLPLAFAGHHRGRVHVAVQRHGDGESDESLREIRFAVRNQIVSAMPALRCAYGSRVSVGASARGESVSDAAARVLVDGDGAGVELPATCGGGLAGLRVRGFVVDARTPGAPVASRAALPTALAMPGQTLALDDFRAVRVGPEDGDVVLVLAREDAAARAVHWIGGASENDLLVTYPLPVEAYEDMSAPLRWSQP